jgi:hypothetical protein
MGGEGQRNAGQGQQKCDELLHDGSFDQRLGLRVVILLRCASAEDWPGIFLTVSPEIKICHEGVTPNIQSLLSGVTFTYSFCNLAKRRYWPKVRQLIRLDRLQGFGKPRASNSLG